MIMDCLSNDAFHHVPVFTLVMAPSSSWMWNLGGAGGGGGGGGGAGAVSLGYNPLLT